MPSLERSVTATVAVAAAVATLARDAIAHGNWIDRLFSVQPLPVQQYTSGRQDVIQRALRGGYPEAHNNMGNALRSLGIGAGERVFVLAGRIPELYIAALGAL